MLRLILSIILLGFAAAIGALLFYYDFPVTAEFQGYLIETSAARLGVIVIFAFVAFYALISLIFWLKNSPKRFKAKRKNARQDNAYSNITLGFSALASGNLDKAQKYADKAQKTLPKQPLVNLLKAQIAVNGGDKPEAEKHYRLLADDEEASFIGYRGLVSQAPNSQKAAEIAEELLRKNPKSTWAAEALIDLGFKNSRWENLEKILKKSEANKAISKDVLNEKFAVYYYMKATIAESETRIEDAEWLAERVLKYRNSFLPAAFFLSALYVKHEEFKKAKAIVKDAWKICPHPALAAQFDLALDGLKQDKVAKVRKLYDSAPDDVESVAYYAKTLIDSKLPDEAKNIIDHGLVMRNSRKLCGLMAMVADKINWQNKMESAEPDKCWHCALTGTRYPNWQLYSDSGKLNTIIWGYPPDLPQSFLTKDQFLFN